jgi:twinkle protein
MTERTYGIRRSSIYTWGAGVGTGKTTLQKQLMLTAMRPDLLEDHAGLDIPIPPARKVGTILFEEKPKKTLRSLAAMALGLRDKPDAPLSKEQLRAEAEKFRGLLFAVDMFGARDWDAVKAQVLYLALHEGVEDLFIDPLTALVAGAEDERRELDAVMADMSGLVENHDFTIHAVSHLTTPQGTAHEEGGRVLEKHFTGSRAIARWSHFMVGLERDKQSPEEPTLVRGLKDREYGEAVGPLIGLSYDRETGRMVEVELADDGTPSNPFSIESDSDL